MPPPEISKRVLDAKVEACKFAFSKLSAVKTTSMKSYKQLRTLLMMKEISRRGADRDYVKDPENSVTRILCSVLKQVVSNSDRSLKSLRGFHYDNLDDEGRQQLMRIIASIRGMGSRKYEPETIDHLDDMSEPLEMEIYLGNGEESGGDMSDIVLGPISWPMETQITLEWVENLMVTLKHFMWKNSVMEFPLILPHSVAVALLDSASEILDKEPNCVKVNCCGDNSRVVVVGDLHGHLHDLLKIFDHAGRPSENQWFVFNGNYIGRGSWSLEVFLVLLAWKILMPERVFLLRGSCETKVCTEELDFMKDAHDRFAEHGPILYSKCLDCFKLLPLASAISNSVYTTHGGLFRSSQVPQDQEKPPIMLGSLEELDQVDRRHAGESDLNLIFLGDVLWSSPWMADGLSENNHRGILWGPDCTETFLKRANLKAIIRSHEGPDARADREDMGNMLGGYSLDHEVESGKLYTVFSASMLSQGSGNYENEGAFAILEPPNFIEPRFVSYTVENIPTVHQQGIISDCSPQQPLVWETRREDNFAATGICNPPTWAVHLPGDPTQSLQLQEPPEVLEGLPLPDNIEEPHKSNYEYLFKLISALKHEIQTRDGRERELMDQLKKTKATLEVISKMSSSL